MYAWRIRFSLYEPDSPHADMVRHVIVRAPTAADALAMFKVRTDYDAKHASTFARGYRGVEHVECFKMEGPFGIWDTAKGDWVRGSLSQVVTIMAQRGQPALTPQVSQEVLKTWATTPELVEGMGPTDNWEVRPFAEEMLK